MNRKRALGLAFMALVAAVVVLTPGAATCAVIELEPLERLSDGTLIDRSASEPDRRAAQALRAAGLERIRQRFFAQPVGAPIVVFAKTGIASLGSNAFGSTHFIGGRSCVVIGPEGENVDVVAHELMHAEVGARVGWLRRLVLPTWLDEGVAMQVDDRTRYVLQQPASPELAARVRALTTGRGFFSGADDELTQRYAVAKSLVAEELTHISLTELLQR